MLRKSHGIAGIELLMLMTVAVLLGFVVFRTYSIRHTQVASTPTAQSTKASPYKNTVELTTAQQQLDQTNLDESVSGTESSELDQDLDSF